MCWDGNKIWQITFLINLSKIVEIFQNEINICVLPMYHIFAMNVTMSGMLYQGGTTITVPMFEPGMFLKTMLEYRPTNLQLAPPLVGFLASHPAVTQDHLASLKTVSFKILYGVSVISFFLRLLLVPLQQVRH